MEQAWEYCKPDSKPETQSMSAGEKKPESPVRRTSRVTPGFGMLSGYPGSASSWKPLIGSRAKAQSPKQSRIVKKTGTLQSLGIELHQERGRTSRPSSPVCEKEPERLSSANLTLWNLLNSIEPPKSFGEEWEFPDKRKLQSIGITDPLVLEKADRLSKRMREPTGKI